MWCENGTTSSWVSQTVTVRRCQREGEQEERAGLLKAERAWNSPEMERNQLSTQMRPSRSIPTCRPYGHLGDHFGHLTYVCGALTRELVASIKLQTVRFRPGIGKRKKKWEKASGSEAMSPVA